MSRKVEEAILASEMEHYYSKEEILTMYLNTVYYGHNYYGIYELLTATLEQALVD